MNKRINTIAVLIGLLLLPVFAVADGGFIPKTEAPPSMPYQRALVSYHRGVETLIVETTLNSDQGEYAWPIPTPATPSKVESCKPHALSGLMDATSPTIHGPELPGVKLILVMIVFSLVAAVTVFFQYREKKLTFWDAVRDGVTWTMLGFMVFVVIFPVYAGSKSGDRPKTVVKSEGTAGSYAYFNLSSSQASEVLGWLSSNGFKLTPSAEKAITTYCDKHWSITALKYQHSKRGAASPHPVRLTFKTDRPVYPMALTGAVTPSLRLDLVVAMESRADIAGMRASRVSRYPSYYHPDILPYVLTDSLATRFRADLTSSRMKDDFYIEPSKEASDFSETWYSDSGALSVAFVKFCLWLPLLLIWGSVFTMIRTESGFVLIRNLGLGVVLLASLFGFSYSRMHRVEVGSDLLRHVAHGTYYEMTKAMEELPYKKVTQPFVRGIREAMAEQSKGLVIPIGDVPGGYEIEVVKGGANLTVYDHHCTPILYEIREEEGTYWVRSY